MANRAKYDSQDPKAPAKLCSDCGGWPALVRPAHNLAYCAECQQKRNQHRKKS